MAMFSESSKAAGKDRTIDPIRKLIIPGCLPGLNEIIYAARGNRYASAAQKKEYTEMIAWMAKAARLPQMNRIQVTFYWYEPNRMRDKDNIMGGQKFILDGLVKAGIIKNDGWKQIADPLLHYFDVDRGNPRVEVEIREVA